MFWEKKRETKVEKLCHNKNCGWILWWIPGVILEWQKKIGHLLSQHLPSLQPNAPNIPFESCIRYIPWQTIADVDFHLKKGPLTANVLILAEKLEYALFGQHELKIFFLQLFTQFTSLGFGPTFIWCYVTKHRIAIWRRKGLEVLFPRFSSKIVGSKAINAGGD